LCFSGQQKNVKHLFLCDFLASRFNHILGGVDHKVIPNTVFDLDLAAPPAMEQLLVEREKSHPQAIQLLWMGGLIPSKGILILFEAITQLAAQGYRFHLSICGTPTAACSQQLIEEKIEQIGSAYLSYHGIVSGEAKFRFLAQSHAFLLPTFYINECQPLAVIEAMAFGLALITTHHSCLKDMTQDGYNGYAVEEQSVTSLVSQLQRLFELSVTDLSQMMRNSQQVFNQHYSGEAYQNAIEHLIFEQDDRRE
jgi:glycosyltransferase involved in cell wall biosynthesis